MEIHANYDTGDTSNWRDFDSGHENRIDIPGLTRVVSQLRNSSQRPQSVIETSPNQPYDNVNMPLIDETRHAFHKACRVTSAVGYSIKQLYT